MERDLTKDRFKSKTLALVDDSRQVSHVRRRDRSQQALVSGQINEEVSN